MVFYEVFWIDCYKGEPHLGFLYERCISTFEAFKQIRFLYDQGKAACAWIRKENSFNNKQEIIYMATFVDNFGNRELHEKYYGNCAK